MNLKPVPVIMFMAGIILLYSAVKNVWPHAVIMEALGKPLPEDKRTIDTRSSTANPGKDTGAQVGKGALFGLGGAVWDWANQGNKYSSTPSTTSRLPYTGGLDV